MPVQLQVLRVSSAYFDILGIRPALGRTFVPGEDELDAIAQEERLP
jgi:hypothetical protein